jgi:hypothetical protein
MSSKLCKPTYHHAPRPPSHKPPHHQDHKEYRSHTQVLQFLGLFAVANQSREAVLGVGVGGDESGEDGTAAVVVYGRKSLTRTSGRELTYIPSHRL